MAPGLLSECCFPIALAVSAAWYSKGIEVGVAAQGPMALISAVPGFVAGIAYTMGNPQLLRN